MGPGGAVRVRRKGSVRHGQYGSAAWLQVLHGEPAGAVRCSDLYDTVRRTVRRASEVQAPTRERQEGRGEGAAVPLRRGAVLRLAGGGVRKGCGKGRALHWRTTGPGRE